MKVKDCMTSHVISIGAQEPVSVAARLMARHNIGTLPVRALDGTLAGIVTDRDITVRCVASERQASAVRVRDVMTPHPTSVSPDMSMTQAAAMMAKGRVRRLPVTEHGRVVGMLALSDLARRDDSSMEAAECLEQICSNVRHADETWDF
ncbi:MAG: CBS domain-containing protein [Oscillospiraceae bacterium]|nr:CBS domain-containing protein [Oscillospiraceae bacterium]